MLLVFQTPLLASEQVCFERPVANKILTEIKYNNITTEKLLVCQQTYSTSRVINILDKKHIEGLKQDKVDLLNVSNEYKQKWIDTAKQTVDCEASKPSKVTWFGVGFVSALIVGLVGLIAIK